MYAVLHLATFSLQAVLRAEADIGKRPAALFDDARNKSVVQVANSSARDAGVEPGMNAPQAIARCPTLLIRTASPAAESEARATLHSVAFTLAPLVEDTAPGICTIGLRGVNLGKLPARITSALAQLHNFGLAVSAGIARTPLLAFYAARATETSLWVHDEAAFLAPLPLANTGAPPDLLGILRDWGLSTFGQLIALPRDAIIRRFGAEGLSLWQRAQGGAPRPLTPVIPAQEFSAQMEFEHALESLEPLLFVLNRLLERLTLDLETAHFVASDIHLRLLLENEKSIALDFRLPEPTGQTVILLRTLHTRLESLQTESAIASIALELAPVRPLVRQQGIFDTGLRDPHGFSETLARLSALVGAENVGTPQLENTHRPDAFKLITPLAVIPPLAVDPVHAPLSPPLRRFRPPLPARLELVDGQPAYVWTESVSGGIVRRSAHLRSSGDWWQADRHWHRLEWDIALDTGGLYRLLREGNAWFLEGEYD